MVLLAPLLYSLSIRRLAVSHIAIVASFMFFNSATSIFIVIVIVVVVRPHPCLYVSQLRPQSQMDCPPTVDGDYVSHVMSLTYQDLTVCLLIIFSSQRLFTDALTPSFQCSIDFSCFSTNNYISMGCSSSNSAADVLSSATSIVTMTKNNGNGVKPSNCRLGLTPYNNDGALETRLDAISAILITVIESLPIAVLHIITHYTVGSALLLLFGMYHYIHMYHKRVRPLNRRYTF
jgi:hypothetical protein